MDDLATALAAVNAASAFNAWAGLEIVEATKGRTTLGLQARPDLLNHAGALHAGLQSALLDTACGYACASVAGNVVTLQMNVQFLASAKAERFEARAQVSKAGKQQLFAEARLFAVRQGEEVLVASASAVLVKLGSERRR